MDWKAGLSEKAMLYAQDKCGQGPAGKCHRLAVSVKTVTGARTATTLDGIYASDCNELAAAGVGVIKMCALRDWLMDHSHIGPTQCRLLYSLHNPNYKNESRSFRPFYFDG